MTIEKLYNEWIDITESLRNITINDFNLTLNIVNSKIGYYFDNVSFIKNNEFDFDLLFLDFKIEYDNELYFDLESVLEEHLKKLNNFNEIKNKINDFKNKINLFKLVNDISDDEFIKLMKEFNSGKN